MLNSLRVLKMKKGNLIQQFITYINISILEKRRQRPILRKMEAINAHIQDLSETCKMYGDLELYYEQAVKYKEFIALNYEYSRLEMQLYKLNRPQKNKVPVSQN